METNTITSIVLPVAIGIIMLGLGLSLTVDDFRRVVVYPKAVAIGLLCQMLVLPAVAFGLAVAFHLPGELAVGLMLLAASPGGASANLYSHLAHGDVALNITITAVNSVLSLLTMPFIVNFALTTFMGRGKVLPLQLDKILQVFAIVLTPVAIGMLLRWRRLSIANRLARPVKILSAVFLLLVIVLTVAKERVRLAGYFADVGIPALLFNLISLGAGYLIPLLVRLPRRQAIAIGMEVGIHNGTLAIAIASSPLLLDNLTMAMPAAVYSLIMFFTAAAFGWWVSRNPDRPQA